MPELPHDPESRIRALMARVGRVALKSRRLVDDQLSGSYASVFKGRGMDFDRVRAYVPGDDVRVIDWNVTARSGDPFIKLFTEERELTIYLAVDISASAAFGSGARSKREAQAEVAAVLAASALRNRDKVGLLLFSDQVELHLPPTKQRAAVLRLVREILNFQPRRRGTDLVAALRQLNRARRRRAIVFLISDFLQPAADHAELLRELSVTARHHELVALRVRDPREAELPAVGLLHAEDAETGEVRLLDTRSAKVRRHWAEQVAAHDEAVEGLLRRAQVDFLSVESGGDWLPRLQQFFRRRAGTH